MERLDRLDARLEESRAFGVLVRFFLLASAGRGLAVLLGFDARPPRPVDAVLLAAGLLVGAWLVLRMFLWVAEEYRGTEG